MKSTLRLATVLAISPDKLGSGEDALIEMARRASDSGISWTLFCYCRTLHPAVRTALADNHVEVHPLQALQHRPFRAWRMFCNDFDVIQLNYIAPREPLAIAAYLSSANTIFVDHCSSPMEEAEADGPLPRRLLDRFTMLGIDMYAGVSGYVLRRAQVRYRMPVEKATVQYNGVDVGRYDSRTVQDFDAWPADRGAVRIAFVGSLIPEKGLATALEAIAELRDVAWVMAVVGTGREEKRLREVAAALGLGRRVRFLGRRDDVPELLMSADVMIHPALWGEAFGQTVVEGMAGECCVLASRVGGIPELLESGEEGLLVPPGDVAAWRRALSYALSDEAGRRKMAVAARRRAFRDFTVASRVAKEIEVIRRFAD